MTAADHAASGRPTLGHGQTIHATAGVPDTASSEPREPPLLDRNPRLALAVFCGLEAAAIGLFLWFGRDQWFFLDEWDFLADRQLGSPDDLLRPHNEHWSTIPIVAYRAIWSLFGLHAYWPYQLLSILNHLAIAALLRVVMRRAGVAPWIATAASALFVLFGSGDENILWAFQLQFASPLTFGLIHLVLADHDGPIGRRDWFGLLAGLAALMGSSVGITMVAVVGLATLVRRGWRAALFHTVPLGAIFSIWWFAYGQEGVMNHSDLEGTVRFALEGLRQTFRTLGMIPGVGVALAAVLVVGVGLMIGRLDGRTARRRMAASIALLVGGVVFLLSAGWGRAWAFGPGYANASRFVHVAAALVLPAVALGVDAIYRRWRSIGLVAVALLLIGIPGNVARSARYGERFEHRLGNPELLLSVGRLPLARELPPDTKPFDRVAREVTLDWLISSIEADKLPCPENRPIRPTRAMAVALGVELERLREAGSTIDCS